MVRNESIREQTGQEKVRAVSQGTSVEKAGARAGMSDDRIAKQVLHWVPENRRKRGRPRVTWQHVITRLREWRTILGSNVFDGRHWIAQCARYGD